jgi:hypothetical protein
MRFKEFLNEATIDYDENDSPADIARKQKQAQRNPRLAASNQITQAKADRAAAQADSEDPASQLKQQRAVLRQRLAKLDQQIAAKSK